MHHPTALLDIHERCHRSLERLVESARRLTERELDAELEGFGYPSVRLQLHHAIAAEKYWLSVIQDRMDASEHEADHASIDALAEFRRQVSADTRAYLQGATPEELNRGRPMKTWRGAEETLVPAHVILRTQTHLFQHQGQVVAMLRLLGQPAPSGLDFPLT